jgi:16S rRNA (guanine966-N2)-methyltransferase
MRIVAGELGGRRLQAPKGDAVRPTTDRVREALFSILGDVEGLDVLDLFCGTGALGLEALSRGAAAVTLVDLDIRPAEANAEGLDVRDRIDLIRADAAAHLRRDGRGYDLVLLDPPYRLARPVAPDLSKLLPPRLRPGARVVVESATDEPLALDPAALPLRDERRYGSTTIRIHELAKATS